MSTNDNKVKINIELENFLSRKINSAENPILKSHYIKIKDFVLRDGKRIRPLISLMSYNAIKGNIPDKNFLPVISSELLHAGTLIQDDIMDEDSLRRNEPSMHKVMQDIFNEEYNIKSSVGDIFKEPSVRFGVSMAILHGNILFTLGEKCLLQADIFPDKKKILLEEYNDALRVVNEGQILDITFALMQDIDEEDYVEMVCKKTAGLFEYSAFSGALLAGGNKEQIKILTDVVKSIAIVFQINDDVLDITDSSAKGHSLGSDIKKGNMTLPIIFALKNADRKQREILSDVLGSNAASQENIKKAIEIIKITGAVEYCKKFAEKEIKKVKAILDKNINKFKDLEFFFDMIEKL